MKALVEKAEVLHEALPYIKRFRGCVFVIKYGGSAMSDPELRDSFARDVVLLKYVGIHPVVVHGGGPQIDRALADRNVVPKRVDGLRVTDDETMEVVERVLGGDVNREIASLITNHGLPAAALNGYKDGFLVASRTGKVQTPSGEWVDIGRVGRLEQVRIGVLDKFKTISEIPVIAPLALGPDGRSLNINADTVAGHVAAALGAEKLVLMTDTEGVSGAGGGLIASLGTGDITRLREQGVISGGMIPKVECALQALQAGVRKCHIIDGRLKHAVILEIFTDQGIGTQIV